MPLQATSGAATYDAFGGGAAAALPTYIEDVFSTYLYTGNSSTQTITNGIDLSGKGGLVWIKRRTDESHYLFDTNRGALVEIPTQADEPSETKANSLTSFNNDGFSLGSWGGTNYSVAPYNTYASWTFRKQPKFFDIQTWTGSGANRTISHALGSVPASIWVKRTDTNGDWQVYHRSLANTEYLVLNSNAAKATGATRWNSTTPTSAVFSLGTDASVNASGGTYVAYLFAHDAGGFGLTGTDNVISCGSYTGNGTAGNAVTLGFEPQWIITKLASSAGGGWLIQDVMRGMSNTGSVALSAQASNAETDYAVSTVIPTATGFTLPSYGGWNASGETYIYIAIRRGPMKVPTLGTSVFAPVAQNASANAVVTTNFPVDLSISAQRSKVENEGTQVFDRLRGTSTTRGLMLRTNRDSSEYVWTSNGMGLANNTALIDNFYNPLFGVTSSVAYWNFRRAPSFFDEVCYTGTGSATTVAHNLTVVPDLMIVKKRSATDSWAVYSKALGTSYGQSNYLLLNTDAGMVSDSTLFNSTAPTSSVFSVGTNSKTNSSAATYVAYLFATCAGVSKVGTYQGTGTTKQIDCGFTAGARFVLIKRTDDVGDWYVWDSARGIVSGNDPYLLLNSTAAEVTSTDYIDTYSAGFEISSTAPAAININFGLFVFLAIA